MLNIRLPDELNQKLVEEARLSHRSRSEVTREALALYLRAHRRRRYIARLQRAAATLREAEARTLAEESLPLDEESFAVGEASENHDANPDRWWK
jgi:predicted transcriptional regulator